MKITMKYLIIVISFLFVSCSGFSIFMQSGTSDEVDQDDISNQEEFDPGTLPEKFTIATPSYKSFQKVQAGNFREITLSDSAQIDSTISVPGFRVQIFTSTSFIRVEEVYLNAFTNFYDIPIYKIFDPPFYKIRVGNFIRREEAELYYNQRIQKFYPEAWVVQSKILPYAYIQNVVLSDSLLFPGLFFPGIGDSVGVVLDSVIIR